MAQVRIVRTVFRVRFTALAALALLVAAGVGTSGGSARAAHTVNVGNAAPLAATVVDVHCSAGAHGERFNPGLLLTPTTDIVLTGSGILAECVTPPGSSAPDPLLSY